MEMGTGRNLIVRCPYCGAEETGWFSREKYEIDVIHDDKVVVEYFMVTCRRCNEKYDVWRKFTLADVECCKMEESE